MPATSRAGNNAMEYDESDGEEAAAAELSEASARAASLAARMPQGANGGLGGACARKKVDWWTFEVCVGERVTQFHDADDHGAFEEHFMGGWVGAAVDVSRGGRVDGAALWRLQYKHGERCDGGAGAHRRSRAPLRRAAGVARLCDHRRARAVDLPLPDRRRRARVPLRRPRRAAAVGGGGGGGGARARRPAAAAAAVAARAAARARSRRDGAAADGGGGGARGDAAPRRGRRRELGGEPRDHPDLRRHGGGRQARRRRERAPTMLGRATRRTRGVRTSSSR